MSSLYPDKLLIKYPKKLFINNDLICFHSLEIVFKKGEFEINIKLLNIDSDKLEETSIFIFNKIVNNEINKIVIEPDSDPRNTIKYVFENAVLINNGVVLDQTSSEESINLTFKSSSIIFE